MKRRWILVLVVLLIALLVGSILFFFPKKETKEKEKEEPIPQPKIEITLKEELEVPFLQEKNVSDFIENINGTIVDDYVIDTTVVGKKEVPFRYINDENQEVEYTYEIEVVDTQKPFTTIGGTYRVKKGSKDTFINHIFCGDNYDPTPDCTIEGAYNLDREGTYPVTFKAVDSSGNTLEKKINLVVYTPTSGGGSSSGSGSKTSFESIVKEHKTEKTKIGLDVSKWQGEINFEKLKKAGVEFIIIRVGSTRGTGGEYYLDEYFKKNIEGANKAGIEVGIYFYSYANTKEYAEQDAKWVLEQLQGHQVDLPVAFDWEDWSNFNDYEVSFYGLSEVATTFLDTIESGGYKGSLYSSKYYLENIWMTTKYPVWLAHYTSKTNYQGDYFLWQLCNNGRVDGIKGDVDIDIMYLDGR